MPIVEFIMIKRYAHVYLTILDVHQIVDPNVLWILIAQQRWLVSAINVKPRAMVHADPTHTAPSSITELIVSAKMDLLAIHTLDAAKLFSVRNVDRILLKSARVSLKSLHFCIVLMVFKRMSWNILYGIAQMIARNLLFLSLKCKQKFIDLKCFAVLISRIE